MKNILFFVIIVIAFSCKKTKNKTINNFNKDEDNFNLIKESANKDLIENSKNENAQIGNEDCIFNQKTQTDEFLKGIKELKNYTWYQETKTAEIILNDHWSLTIKRGGCYHFAVSADFIYDRVIDFEQNKKIIFGKIIWISNLLEEFDGQILKKVINENKLNIEFEDNKHHIHFMDNRLYETYYMNFYIDEKASYIHLSYYIN